ncbi:MGDG synthase family glycosyltransferase [Sporolactobacillus spathodeae]|uniref:Processive 1,2-diacylglycerol beta-glucosyltransferase n=1 Tax=Sporolactobacillus spathodeae TaxID=1465502 RepID=A0ABS2QBE9_9BACL|nr:glycosyltransferase [Sporolactobacillus spathodeae]MBM7658951.1 processive 1,2-diacylglycerol beta-glucosyltransferase [Sporolactobacillus spathodeae]
MMRSVKVLILTGSYGGGHEQAALALEQAFNLNPNHYHAEVLDITTLVPSKLDSFEKKAFLSGVTHFPMLYHFLYKKTQKNNAAASVLKSLSRVGVTRLVSFIESTRPDLIISTFPPASIMMSQMKRAGCFSNLPFLTVITDYSVHSTWVNRWTDGYLVASEDVRKRLIEMKVNPERIFVTGIPIRPDFSLKARSSLLRAKYNIPTNQKVILVMGGGCGIFSHFLAFFKELDKQPIKNSRFVIICGRNEKAYKEFTEFSKTAAYPIQVLGFVSNMNDWMAIADLLVTKPGGLTISEAIASELPMLIYRPLGGQEADNTQYLLSTGVSIVAYTPPELMANLMNLLEHHDAIEIMRTNMKTLSNNQKHSAEQAVRAATQFLPVSVRHKMEFA